MGKHYEVNENNLTTAAELDAQIEELVEFAQFVGECFDSIALDEVGHQRDRLNGEEDRQVMDLLFFIPRITRLIGETTKRRAKL